MTSTTTTLNATSVVARQNMKKTLLILTVLMSFGTMFLVGCGDKEADSTDYGGEVKSAPGEAANAKKGGPTPVDPNL